MIPERSVINSGEQRTYRKRRRLGNESAARRHVLSQLQDFR